MSTMPASLDRRMTTSSDGESDDEQPVETLVAGRAKRLTAGNRMSTMIGEIAADDDLELLFAEDEDAGPDEEFEEDAEEQGSDNDLGNSSDDEDQGPAAGADDLDGEKEIERQAKEERKRKRKAQREFTKPSKRVKHAPFIGRTAPSIPASKAKKKVERLSWAPTANDATRTSKRETTTQQSEALRTRIVAREKERKEQLKRLEEKARRREANKPRKLTQEDRLKEAAEVEKENSKSLNRWEAIERERQEEQRLRLEALQNRKLHGPVISYWSGPAKWQGEKLVAVGSEKIKLEEHQPDTKGAVSSDQDHDQSLQDATLQTSQDTERHLDEQSSKPAVAKEVDQETESSLDKEKQEIPAIEMPTRPRSSGSVTTSIQAQTTTDGPSADRLNSSQPPTRDPSHSRMPSPSPQPSTSEGLPRSEVPSISPQPVQMGEEGTAAASPQPPSSVQAEKHGSADTSGALERSKDQLGASIVKEEPSSAPPTLLDVPKPQPVGGQQIVFSILPPRNDTKQSSVLSVSTNDSQSQAKTTATTDQAQMPASGPPSTPPKPIVAVRNLISVINVDVTNPTSSTLPKEIRGSILISTSKAVKKNRVAKVPPPPACQVTGLPIKYRDPSSSIGYANAYAYRQLKGVRDGRLEWNELTSTFIGPSSRIADGVPDGFAEAMSAGQT